MRRLIAPTLAVIAMLAGFLVAPAASAVEQTVVADAATTVDVVSALDAETAIGDSIQTADLSKFQAGNIISDAVFFDKSTMTEAQIQAFLEKMVPTCQSGYTCLKDWYDTSRNVSADAMCGAYSGGTRERASRIIYKVSQACGINPQVILATLQKEQGLVNHVWPSDWRYRIAMGQGCPDTAACDTRYYGFFNQVYGAAWQFKRYANPAGTSQYFTWYAPGKTWNILWNPNHDCGSSPVYVQNQATANLYYYTPYQPNAAAIRAGYGTGDGCSSYGNRNFYQYFTDWFGSTTTPVNACAQPSSPKTAVKTYVVTASSLNARSAPSLACDENISALAQDTVLQATAVVDGWLRVDTESGARWVAREHVRYAAADESVCALPPKVGSAQYAYVLVADSTGRAVPNSGCELNSTEISAGTIVQAFAVSDDRNWVKVHIGDVDGWVDRAALRRADTMETACALPGDTSAAHMVYTIRESGTSGLTSPNPECGIGRATLSGQTVVQAVSANGDRDWLLVSSGRGLLWVDRSHLTRLASTADPCEVRVSSRAAQRTYLLDVDTEALSSPTTVCDTGSVPISAGTVLRPKASTEAGDWLQVETDQGMRWVPRGSVRQVTSEELCAEPPADATSAMKTYTFLATATARTAPYAECASGVVEVAAGTVATAVEVNGARDWLKLRLAEGDLWVPRDAVRYATSGESCTQPSDVRSAYKTYVVRSEGSVSRSAPSLECGRGVVEMSAGTVLTAKAVTADRQWLLFESSSGEDLWLPRDDVDYQ